MTVETSVRKRGRRQVQTGVVVSDKQDKTIVVRVDRTVLDPLYRRYVKRSNRVHAHDEENQCRVGDRVEIVSTRPVSRLKRWRLQAILERAEGS